MANLNFLTDSDLAVIRSLVEQSRSMVQNTTNRPAVEELDYPSTDCYVAKAVDGIPGLLKELNPAGTGTAAGNQGDMPGEADCDIYHMIDVSGVPTLIDMDFQKTVYNLSDDDVAAGEWVVVVKDKSGRWLAVQPAGATETKWVKVLCILLGTGGYPGLDSDFPGDSDVTGDVSPGVVTVTPDDITQFRVGMQLLAVDSLCASEIVTVDKINTEDATFDATFTLALVAPVILWHSGFWVEFNPTEYTPIQNDVDEPVVYLATRMPDNITDGGKVYRALGGITAVVNCSDGSQFVWYAGRLVSLTTPGTGTGSGSAGITIS